ncbi:hypothetical protein [Bacillus sp. EB600]|uniref:hypothetical protein n=1 Tax=Bacillus sp. EB600 TaxID=2806345 RepID=UPI00210E07B3|nr:hypothetical protein [Bacillus sp. EB600]MCQ6278433.1 hypothetical protein [Bacillus sp. EB600]
MDKKQFTFWGVSFGSLALVAGMVSYLGLNTKDTTAKSNQSPASSQNSIQQVPSQTENSQNTFGSRANDNDASSSSGDDQPTTDNRASSSYGDDQPTNNNGASSSFGNDQVTNNNGASSSFGDDQPTTDSSQSLFDNGSSQQNSNQSSGQRSFGHHGRFDTTTGGT